MRSSILVFALAAIALAGPAWAGSGACIPSCDIPSNTSLGFLPPVVFVERGSTVTWSSLDGGHTATGHATVVQPACFHTEYNSARTGSAFFTVLDGKLFTISELNGGELVECDHALASPDGTFVLDYICDFHGRMAGKLVIR